MPFLTLLCGNREIRDFKQFYLLLGVTTRLQREQQAKTVNQQPRADAQQPSEPATSSSPPAAATSTTTASSPPSSASTTTSSTTSAATASIVASPSTSSAAGVVASQPGAPSSSSPSVSTAPTSNCVSTNSSVISTSSSAATAPSVVAASPTGAATNDHDMSMDTDENKPKGFAGCFGGGAGEEFFGKDGTKEGAGGVILDGQKQCGAEGVTVKKENDSTQEMAT